MKNKYCTCEEPNFWRGYYPNCDKFTERICMACNKFEDPEKTYATKFDMSYLKAKAFNKSFKLAPRNPWIFSSSHIPFKATIRRLVKNGLIRRAL